MYYEAPAYPEHSSSTCSTRTSSRSHYLLYSSRSTGFQWNNGQYSRSYTYHLKAQHQLAPPYISELIVPYNPPRKLRSSTQSLLAVTYRPSTKFYGERVLSMLPPPSGMTCLYMFDLPITPYIFFKLTGFFNRAGCWRSWLMVYILVTSPLLLVLWCFSFRMDTLSFYLFIFVTYGSTCSQMLKILADGASAGNLSLLVSNCKAHAIGALTD